MLDRFMVVGVAPLRRSTPTALDIAWAAGLFEGEGHWRIRFGSSEVVRSVDAALASTDQDVVRKFADIVGFGTIRPVQPPNPRAKLQYRWESARREDIKRMAALFLPHLGARRAERARLILAVPPPKPHRDRNCGRRHLVKELN